MSQHSPYFAGRGELPATHVRARSQNQVIIQAADVLKLISSAESTKFISRVVQYVEAVDE